ncbi:polysaccharide deacetylase [Clostridium intestinale]|uniref:Polysaccharide deacetylase n=2 Tax=Clostridium intestinale TaxID=36845 RepID=A0A7D7A1S9_9CLOT|nr:polysaccharide deacetylase [Clostridium intestinale]
MEVIEMSKIKFLILFIVALLLNSNIVFAEELSKENPQKIIYLTFDDGPTKLSNDILDILKEENVKATFFVIGEQIKDNKETLIRMNNDGHSIGLHSYTHKRENLYLSKASFLSEMKKTQSEIKDLIGLETNILRFPFGCNNISYKINNSMVELLHEENLKIYDWTQDSGDGANYNLEPNKIFKNSISEKDSIILLLHCSNKHKNTVKALPYIIKYYKEKGYTFKTIDEQTKEQFHIIK